MITITVSNKLDSFDYKSYFADYHDGAGTGSPVFSEGTSGFDGDRISLIYTDETKQVLLDGEDFQYTLSNHYLSGRLQEVTYTENGKAQLTIEGLDVYTPRGENDPLGPLIYSLMGNDPSSGDTGDINPALLVKTIGAEAQHFIGGKGDDTYTGTKFADIIEANGGDDVFTGGQGKDAFVFDVKVKAANHVEITDFKVKQDTIELDNSFFKALKGTDLSAGAFYKGAAAHDADDRIIYNSKTGALLYDADGNGKGQAIEFATLDKNLKLTVGDFDLI